jgi:uroporphyrinogen-III synthase
MPKMPNRAFISRQLTENSPFRERLATLGWEAVGLPLVKFQPLPFAPLPTADWVFFYSKTAVCFFLEGLGGPPPKALRWAALGKGTAAAMQEAGLRVDFTGTGHPESTAAAFGALARGQRVLFPRARHSQQSVERLLDGKIQAVSLVVYDNIPVENPLIPPCQILVFTSPLNAATYFDAHPLLKGQQVVAIGHTTAAALRRLGIDCRTAPEPSEAGLAAAVLECINVLEL